MIAPHFVVEDISVTSIAEIKQADLNAHDLEHATRIIEGTARSMGLNVN